MQLFWQTACWSRNNWRHPWMLIGSQDCWHNGPRQKRASDLPRSCVFPSSSLAPKHGGRGFFEQPFHSDFKGNWSSPSFWPGPRLWQRVHHISSQSCGWFHPLGLGCRSRSSLQIKVCNQPQQQQSKSVPHQASPSMHLKPRSNNLGSSSQSHAPSSSNRHPDRPRPPQHYNFPPGRWSRRGEQATLQRTWAYDWARWAQEKQDQERSQIDPQEFFSSLRWTAKWFQMNQWILASISWIASQLHSQSKNWIAS